jgi:hypothetical protein
LGGERVRPSIRFSIWAGNAFSCKVRESSCQQFELISGYGNVVFIVHCFVTMVSWSINSRESESGTFSGGHHFCECSLVDWWTPEASEAHILTVFGSGMLGILQFHQHAYPDGARTRHIWYNDTNASMCGVYCVVQGRPAAELGNSFFFNSQQIHTCHPWSRTVLP